MRPWRPALLAGLALVTGCGGGSGPARPHEDPFVAVGRRQAQPQAPHSAPHWQRVASFGGSAGAAPRVAIRPDALQWRLAWRCQRGSLAITAGQAGGRPQRLVAARCPRRGRALSLTHGRLGLRVRASGPWRVAVEQQLDSPLHERPLPAMTAPGARRTARGTFSGVERKGEGRVSLYRLAGGRLALRLDAFATTTNTDLVVWLSSARRPRTSREAFGAHHTLVAPLRATVGDQNYLVPRGTPARDLRSVVIWCVPQRIAYTAATLRP